MKKRKDLVLARLTLCKVSEMAPWERESIAAWLKAQATGLVSEGHMYAKLYTATYRYGKGE